MEIPVQVAVRLRPNDNYNQYYYTNPTAQIVFSQSGQSFQVNQALPFNCSQDYVFSSVVSTQLSCFLEGCDVSLISLGQANTGKTYALLGPGPEFLSSNSEQGIIPRFLQETFSRLSVLPERSFVLHITWMQVVQESIVDLLGSGLVKCNNLNEALQYLQSGWKAMSVKACHTIFTVSIEQKWIDSNGMLYHRLSTASFYELAAYPEPSLYAFENIVKALINPSNDVPVNYEQSVLTAMLRDSLGGRAYTWLLCCASSSFNDAQDTLRNLNLSWCCQGVKNFVTVNSFADNNTQVHPEKSAQQIPEQVFGLQFAAEQWIKLVNNAESLFQKILALKVLSDADCTQVSEWLVLKAECTECLKDEVIRDDARKRGLPRIAEDTEPSEPSDSDDESDASTNQDDSAFRDKLDKYMQYFREKTDELVSDKNEEYLKDKCKINLSQDKRKGLRESRYDSKEKKNNALKHVSSRISHLDDILKEKSSDLKKSELSAEKESMLRKEISHFRKTRECLLEQRCSLGNKWKTNKSLSGSEERKLVECDEAIEAIDTAIEYKNALICGRSPSEMSRASGGKDSKSSYSSKGGQTLMARLEKLPHEEIKSLLYKYFQKVVDLRGECSALERVIATAFSAERATCPCLQMQTERHEHARRNANIATRHYHQLQRAVGGSTAIKSSTNFKALMGNPDSCDESSRMLDRARQSMRCHRDTTIPSQKLKQLIPATTAHVAKVTKLKNKLVIIKEDRPPY